MSESGHEDKVLDEGVVGGDLIRSEGSKGLQEDVCCLFEVSNGHEVDSLVRL